MENKRLRNTRFWVSIPILIPLFVFAVFVNILRIIGEVMVVIGEHVEWLSEQIDRKTTKLFQLDNWIEWVKRGDAS